MKLVASIAKVVHHRRKANKLRRDVNAHLVVRCSERSRMEEKEVVEGLKSRVGRL